VETLPGDVVEERESSQTSTQSPPTIGTMIGPNITPTRVERDRIPNPWPGRAAVSAVTTRTPIRFFPRSAPRLPSIEHLVAEDGHEDEPGPRSARVRRPETGRLTAEGGLRRSAGLLGAATATMITLMITAGNHGDPTRRSSLARKRWPHVGELELPTPGMVTNSEGAAP